MNDAEVPPRTRCEARDCGAHATTDDTNIGPNSAPTTDNGKSKRVDSFLIHKLKVQFYKLITCNIKTT